MRISFPARYAVPFCVATALAAGPALAQAPTAAAPYTLSVFATAPSGLSAPDSIAVVGQHVFVGYGDGHKPDGSDGLSSQVVEYGPTGNVVTIYTVPGHNDGLKYDPVNHVLWAVENEDANPHVVIIDPVHRQQRLYPFSATPHGGGYDDIVFRGCKVFISASNPANNPNFGPAIVSARIGRGVINVAPVLSGSAVATDIPSDANIVLNLQDPDSMTLNTVGDIVLDSQADQELIIVSNPGQASQRAVRLPLTYATKKGYAAVETDDTAFTTSSQGFILFADKGLNTVYALNKSAFAPGAAYTAADGGPFVGTLDITTGVITPIVTGLMSPGGLVYVDTSRHAAVPPLKCN
jgi:hypothetical protein